MDVIQAEWHLIDYAPMTWWPSTRAILIFVVTVIAASPAEAGGPDSDGPTAAEKRAAQTLATQLRRADGIARALRLLCVADREPGLRHDTAVAVLIQRAARAMPSLLAAIADVQARPDDADDRALICAQESTDIAVASVCDLRDYDPYGLDRRSDAALARDGAAARRALLDALARPGARRGAALAVLSDTFHSQNGLRYCPANTELLYRATPALARMMAANEQVNEILQLFAEKGAEPAVAVPAVRAYLDGERVALAVLALTALGEDMSAQTDRLTALLAGPQIETAIDALGAIGRGARAALPRLIGLQQGLDADCRRPVRPEVLVAALAAIAAPRDTALVVPALAAILSRCSEARFATITALGRFGQEGRTALLAYLRNDDHKVADRLAVANHLHNQAPLDRSDLDIVARLHHKKRTEPVPSQVVPPREIQKVRDPIADAADEVNDCRAEAGLRPIAVTGIGADQSAPLRWCLRSYLCGPSRTTLARTLDRCCGQALGKQRLPFCRP